MLHLPSTDQLSWVISSVHGSYSPQPVAPSSYFLPLISTDIYWAELNPRDDPTEVTTTGSQILHHPKDGTNVNRTNQPVLKLFYNGL